MMNILSEGTNRAGGRIKMYHDGRPMITFGSVGVPIMRDSCAKTKPELEQTRELAK